LSHVSKIKELDNANKLLAAQIEKAESMGDEVNDLKKQFYSNKLEMIRLYEIRNKRNGMTFRQLKDKILKMPHVPRYDTGIRPLDDALQGIEQGTFIQFGGESGTGKTYLVTEILANIATYKKAVFFSFEMGMRRTKKRLSKLIQSEAQEDNLIIDFDTRNLDELCNEIILYANNDGIKFFAIDSKMKIEVTENLDDYQKASLISARLAKIAQQNDVIVFLINQINEQDIKSKRLAFKGSGDQKYDADISLFYVLHENEGQRKLICNKNRTGDEQTFELDLKLLGNRTVDIRET
jgi:predicted ATP-dependent serine protease